MSKATLCLALLAASLVASLAKPADVVARVPSNYYQGTKWVLFRDDSIPDPPPNVIQAENGVQVLPTYRYQQQPQYQSYAYVSHQAPVQLAQRVHVTAAPVHVQSAPVHVPLQLPVQQPVHYSSFHVTPVHVPVRVTQTPVHVTTPSPAHFDAEVVESSSQVGQKPQYQFGQNQVVQQHFNQQFHQKVQEIVRKNPVVTKVSSYGVTAVPHTAVHVTSPAYVDYLRKKKSATVDFATRA